MKIVKRDGHMVDYDASKIENAVEKANLEVTNNEKASKKEIAEIIYYIEHLRKKRILVEDIQDIIEEKLMELGKYKLAREYITYRYTRELVRKANTTDQTIKELIEGKSIYLNEKELGKNVELVTSQRNAIAGITSADITRRFLLPEDIVNAHDEGLIYFHNSDYFAQNALSNCEVINLADMLQNGTIINGVKIDKPKRFIEAATITSQIILEVMASSYGGATISASHLAPFVRDSYEIYYKKYKLKGISDKEAEKNAKEDTKNEIKDGINIIIYQISLLQNLANPTSKVSINLYLNETWVYKDELALVIETFLNQSVTRYADSKLPKVDNTYKFVYVLEEDNINENCKYWYLTKLAKECVTNEIQFIPEKRMKEMLKEENGNIKYYGRFNQGIVTVNLADVAISSDKIIEKFWNVLDERLELCHRALQIRHKRLSNVTSNVAPILWQNGAIARLKEGETIHNLLHHGYSTLTLGFAGLDECISYMTESDQDELKLQEKVIQYLQYAIKKWREAEDIEYNLYSTVDETINSRLVQCIKEKNGEVKGITDKNKLSNVMYNDATDLI